MAAAGVGCEIGLRSQLPGALYRGLTAQGVLATLAGHVANLPPVSTIFAAFLGYNPIQTLLDPTGALAHLPASRADLLTGKEFFPHLIAGAFHHGLVVVFIAAAIMAVLAAGVSLLRGPELSGVSRTNVIEPMF